MTFTDDTWNYLIKLIQDENVIPVLGDELLITEYKGKKATLYEHIAQYICEKEKISCEDLKIIYHETPSLNDVIHYLIKKHKDERDDSVVSQSYLKHISEFLKNTELHCEALELLAKIDGFKMFISTTFDDFAKKIFEKFGRNSITVKRWVEQKNTANILKDDIENSNCVPQNLIFHLFGEYNVGEFRIGEGVVYRSIYAITDDDILMYLSQMVNGDFQTKAISQLLKKEDVHLLFLGWSHSDWLYRFLMYTLKQGKIYLESTKHHKIFLADERIKDDKFLIKFIQRLNASLYDEGDPLAFIKELYKRWAALPADNNPQKPDIFLSYASENKEKAMEVYNWIKKEINCKIWVDKKSLKFGAPWREKVIDAITHCKIFIPLISDIAAKSKPEDDREFLKEWELASQRRSSAPKGHKDFIIPIRIDEVDVNNEIISKQFKEIHIMDWDGENNEEVLKKIINIKLN